MFWWWCVTFGIVAILVYVHPVLLENKKFRKLNLRMEKDQASETLCSVSMLENGVQKLKKSQQQNGVACTWLFNDIFVISLYINSKGRIIYERVIGKLRK
jgi:hypothetical protein